jgi:hypothetical protein
LLSKINFYKNSLNSNKPLANNSDFIVDLRHCARRPHSPSLKRGKTPMGPIELVLRFRILRSVKMLIDFLSPTLHPLCSFAPQRRCPADSRVAASFLHRRIEETSSPTVCALWIGGKVSSLRVWDWILVLREVCILPPPPARFLSLVSPSDRWSDVATSNPCSLTPLLVQ